MVDLVNPPRIQFADDRMIHMANLPPFISMWQSYKGSQGTEYMEALVAWGNIGVPWWREDEEMNIGKIEAGRIWPRDCYQAGLSERMDIFPDEENPTATGDMVLKAVWIQPGDLCECKYHPCPVQSGSCTECCDLFPRISARHIGDCWRGVSGDCHASFEFKKMIFNICLVCPLLHHGCPDGVIYGVCRSLSFDPGTSV